MTLTVFPDAQLSTLAILRAADPAYVDGVTFGVDPLDPTKGIALPYVAVKIDGTRVRAGANRTDREASLRVSVWHSTEAKSLALAEKVLAILAAFEGDANVRKFQERTAPLPTTDPDSGSPLSFFIVAARLRPTTL